MGGLCAASGRFGRTADESTSVVLLPPTALPRSCRPSWLATRPRRPSPGATFRRSEPIDRTRRCVDVEPASNLSRSQPLQRRRSGRTGAPAGPSICRTPNLAASSQLQRSKPLDREPPHRRRRRKSSPSLAGEKPLHPARWRRPSPSPSRGCRPPRQLAGADRTNSASRWSRRAKWPPSARPRGRRGGSYQDYDGVRFTRPRRRLG
jgi:hypothetical protein